MRTLTALLVLLVLAGCGGGYGDGDYAKRAVAICGGANDRIRALGAPESFTDTQLYARRAKDAVRDELHDLRQLSPPANQADAFDVYLVTLEERERLLGELADAADATNMSDVRGVGSEIAALDATSREQATSAGIADCEPG